MVVHPGDIMVGDEDGVLAIPPADAAAVIEAARRQGEKEAESLLAIAEGRFDRAVPLVVISVALGLPSRNGRIGCVRSRAAAAGGTSSAAAAPDGWTLGVEALTGHRQQSSRHRHMIVPPPSTLIVEPVTKRFDTA